MAQSITRKQFLRGDFRNQHAAIRPPWAYDENEFVERCSRCNECIKHCPESIIVPDKHGFPMVDFTKGECLLCHECVDHCEPEALSQDLDRPPWDLKAEITEQRRRSMDQHEKGLTAGKTCIDCHKGIAHS